MLMTKKDYSNPQFKKAIQGWKKAQPVMEEIRRQEIEQANTVEALVALKDLFEDAIQRFEMRTTSGLIEQQYWFKKFAEKSDR